MDDVFYVAVMQPVLHYTMGCVALRTPSWAPLTVSHSGLEINPESAVINTQGKPIPGLYACGEIGGGVHGANRLGGSSLLGCVVYGRVAGASAASYLLQGLTSGTIASQRLGQLAQQLETRVRIDPATKRVNLEFSWDNDSASASAQPSTSAAQSQPAQHGDDKVVETKEEAAPKKQEMKEYTLEEVAQHKAKGDIVRLVSDSLGGSWIADPSYSGSPSTGRCSTSPSSSRITLAVPRPSSCTPARTVRRSR
jgi:succinate dehydrogenase/fumarate reductase flavoprotein subunit